MTAARPQSIDLDRVGAVVARSRFSHFVKRAWHVVEPGRPLAWGWHLNVLCDHLQAVFDGRIKELLVTIPPGTTKSRVAAVFFPAWYWLHRPNFRFMFVSNADELATRDSIACRQLVESHWYRHSFGIPWRMRRDQNLKTWFENTAGGHRQCMGINASITGKKCDGLLVDDANDAESVQSEAERNRVNNKFDRSIWDRLTDFRDGWRVVLGQRSHRNDLLGHVEEKYRWPRLNIPEEFNPTKRSVSPIGWTDPRTKPGQLLRPEQFGPQLVAQYKERDKAGFECKHNQEPRSVEGTRFKLANLRWWRREGDWWVLPCPVRGEYRFTDRQILHRYGTADGASSAKTSADYTVISSWVVSPRHDLVWVGCHRAQLQIPDQPAVVAAEYRRWGLEFLFTEAVAGNVALYQFLAREAVNVLAVDPRQRDKLTRAVPAIIFTEGFRLFLPDAGESPGFPTADVQDELTNFTGDDKVDEHDDIVDTLSYAVEWLTGMYPVSLPRPANVPAAVGGVTPPGQPPPPRPLPPSGPAHSRPYTTPPGIHRPR